MTLAADGPAGLEQLAHERVRPAAAGPGAAGRERHRSAAAHSGDAADAAGDHDYGVRQGVERGGRHPRGRGELRPEAMGQREAAGGHSRRHRAASRGRRAGAAEARAEAALQLREHRGQERADAAAVRPGGAGGAQPLHRAGAGRERDGQGADRQGAARQLAAPQQAVCAGEHGLGAVGAAGIDALRPCAGRVHLGGGGQEGPVRGGQRRHALSGRDRHHGHGHAGQDPARAAGPALHASGRDRGDPGGRAHHRGHQRRPASRRCARAASAKTSTTG